VLPNGEPVRKSAKTRSWEKAEHRAREMDVVDPALAVVELREI